MSVSSWTLEDFCSGARKLVDVIRRLGISDHLMEWELKSESTDEVMLTHTPVARASCFTVEEETGRDTDEEYLVETNLNADPDTYRVNENTQSQTIWRFSIVYSHTWRVPVLYFDVQNQDGSPCSRTKVVGMLNKAHHQNRIPDSWDFVSYEEHPLTGFPSLFLHPCRTRDRMDRMQANTDDQALRLLSWMSMILPSVGYSIPSTQFKRIKDELSIND